MANQTPNSGRNHSFQPKSVLLGWPSGTYFYMISAHAYDGRQPVGELVWDLKTRTITFGQERWSYERASQYVQVSRN